MTTRIIRTNPTTPLSESKVGPDAVNLPEEPSSFDVDELLDKAAMILAREVRNLAIASGRGKLDTAEARDLVAYIKLLSDIKESQTEFLAKLTDEQLLKLKSK